MALDRKGKLRSGMAILSLALALTGARGFAADRAHPDSGARSALASPTDSPTRNAGALSEEDSVSHHTIATAISIVRINDSLAQADSLRRDSLLAQIVRLGKRDSTRLLRLQVRLDSIGREDSLRKVRQLASINSLRNSVRAYPVRLDGDTLFSIFLKLGSFSAQERAQAISRRLETIAETPKAQADSILTFTGETSTDILFHETIVMSVTDKDALWFNQGKEELAARYVGKMRTAVSRYQKSHAITQRILHGLIIALVVALFALLAYGIRRFFRWLRLKALRTRDRRLRGVRFKNIELLSSEQALTILNVGLRSLEVFAFGVALYLSLPLLFGVIPATREWSGKLLGWVFSPLKTIVFGAIGYLPNLLNIIVIFTVTHYALKIGRKIFEAVEKGTLKLEGFYPDWAKPTFNIVRLLIYALMFIAIFPLLPGSNSPIFRGVSVFLGVLFSLGSTSAVGNMVAGLVITYMRPFRIGDRVKLGDVTGDVLEKTMLVTRLRTIKNEDITIPNAAILLGHTVNYTTASEGMGLILHATITIGYDIPWRRIHQLLLDAAALTPGIRKDKESFVLQTSLDDSYVSYQINAYTDKPAEMASTYSLLNQNIQDVFNAAAVEIMSPHYSALRDGNYTTVPAESRPKDYVAGVFRMASFPGKPSPSPSPGPEPKAG